MGFFDELLGGGKKTPFVTDPQELIKQQDLLNRLNISTPEGGRTFGVDPETGRSTLEITESPFQQQTRAAKEALATSFLSDLSGGDDRFADESKRIGDLTFERGLSRLAPTLETARRRTETQLATQGLPVGSEARRGELDRLSQNEQDLLVNLAGSSELAASNEQSRLRGLALNEANVFGEQLQDIDVGGFASGIPTIDAIGAVNTADSQKQNRAKLEATRKNTQRENAIGLFEAGSSFIGGLPTGTFGTEAGTAGAFGPTQGSGLTGLMSGGGGSSLASLGSFFASDERLKEDIEKIGKQNGHNIYEWNYKDKEKFGAGRFRGVMAHEVEVLKPEAVTNIDGYKAVNYDMIGLQMEAV